MTEPKPTYAIPNHFILALDASTTAVGWCYARGSEYVASGIVKLKAEDAWQRMRLFRRWLEQHLDSLSPAVVAIEEPTGAHGNARTDRLLGAVVGVALAECDRCDPSPEFVLVNAASVKATGFCKDTVHDVALLICKEADVSDDEADAIGVWQAALKGLREDTWLELAEEKETQWTSN